VVEVDRQANLRPDRLAHLAEPVRTDVDRLHRLEGLLLEFVRVRALAGAEAQALPALRDPLLCLGDALRAVQRVGRRRREAGYRVAAGAPEQLVHRNAERLPQDVPQGDVDGGDDGPEDLAAFEIRGAVERLPEMLDPPRVLADQELPKMIEHPL